jgi:plastocyanin
MRNSKKFKMLTVSKGKGLLLGVGLLMLQLPISSGATTHIVNFGGSLGLFFSPSSFTAHVGDTVTWIGDFTMHSTTSVTIPAGAAPWNHGAGGTGAGTTFSYGITVAGTYSYHCNIHYSEGMAGSFTATSTAIGQRMNPENMLPVARVRTASGRTFITLTLPAKGAVDAALFTLSGEKRAGLVNGLLAPGVYAIPLEGVESGAYIVRLSVGGRDLSLQAFVMGK